MNLVEGFGEKDASQVKLLEQVIDFMRGKSGMLDEKGEGFRIGSEKGFECLQTFRV